MTPRADRPRPDARAPRRPTGARPRLRALAWVTLALAGAALSSCAPAEPALTRAEARAMAGPAADTGRDLCEELGFYGDGEFCDMFCQSADPDCSAPCAAASDCPAIDCAGAECGQASCEAGRCDADLCTARLSWLQKDAYVSRAGRGAAFWPPHTTMVLSVRCAGETVSERVAANHGTLPDAVDASGAPILEEVWADTLTGTRTELTHLANSFAACECGNTFLSLDELEAARVDDLLSELTDYVAANLQCSGDTQQQLMDALAAGDVEFILDVSASECTWGSGAGWAQGLDDALQTVAASSRARLADYHVCNNDALLQADLFTRFRAGDGTACDGASSLCAGPAWYYEPRR